MKRVFVGLSGGVDSAVSAALLQQQGYDVTGAFIKIWRPEFIECPWQKERLDAMRVCAHLGILFKEIDLSDIYKKEVIDDMIRNYESGITPNPDILCNRHIKFGAFKDWALSQGADLIATGHYARLENGELHRGVDPQKDQSYFLARLTKEDLAHTLFPVGGYTKTQVRALAERFKLPVARKHDSQGLCFVGEVSMRDFLARYINLKQGPVVDTEGNVIGEHDGAALYTLGERHGFRIHTQSAHTKPHFVVGIDTATNTLVVSTDLSRAYTRSCGLSDILWHTEVSEADAQARYREKPVHVRIAGETVYFDDQHLAPPGQTLAFYDGSRLVGSGILTAQR